MTNARWSTPKREWKVLLGDSHALIVYPADGRDGRAPTLNIPNEFPDVRWHRPAK